MIVKVSLDLKTKLSNKPDRNTKEGQDLIGAIVNRLTPTEVTIAELASYIIDGYSWSPSVCSQKKTVEYFVFSRLLAMDFDNKRSVITPEQVKTRLEEYGIDWKFFHTSFSDTPETRKFRVVFDSGRHLDKTETLNYLNRLHVLFPEADLTSNRLVQFYFGGRELLFEDFDSTPLNYDLLKSAADSEAAKNCSPSAAKNAINRKTRLKISENEYLLFIEGEKATYDIISKPDFNRLCDRVVLIKALRDGVPESTEQYEIGDRLSYPDLFTAITNLLPFEGGLKQAERWMVADGRYESKHYRIFNSLRKHPDYFPANLCYSPFIKDHRYSNAATAYKNEGKAVKIPNVKLSAYTVEEADKIMTAAFYDAVDRKDNSVTVLKFATGQGKTRMQAEIYKQYERQGVALFCGFTTHKLKDEFINKYLGETETLSAVVTPEQPPNIPGNIDELYNVGAYIKAQAAIKALKRKTKDTDLKEQLLSYERRNAEAYGTQTRSIIGTTRKALTKNARTNRYPFGHCKLFIFDEDIISELLPTYYITREDLNVLRSLVRREQNDNLTRSVEPVISYYLEIIEKEAYIIQDMPHFVISDKANLLLTTIVADNSNRFDGNILDVFRLRGKFCLDTNDLGKLNFVGKKELPSDRQYIILSATADENIYRYLIDEDRLNFVDISNVVPKGKLIQDTTKSCSRRSLSNPETENYVRIKLEEAGDPEVITFKAFKDRFLNVCKNIHFGNCSGYDDLKGKNIAVVGTPHPPQSLVELIAAVLGMETPPYVSVVQQEIFRNGFRFIFRTYENLNLQNIHLALIEQELIQAVGRARILRTNATVWLFSNYPLPDYSDVKIININETVEV